MRTRHALILGLSLIAAALVFGIFFYGARATDNVVSVVGAATKRFDSDIVKWRITLSRPATMTGVGETYKLIQNDLQFVKKLLMDKGLSDQDITIQPVNTYPQYDRNGQMSGYQVQQGIYVISSDLGAVEGLALNPAELTDKGIVVQNSDLQYFYSKLSDIKLELLAEATKDAQRRAKEIADNSGSSMGDVTSLRAGVFQITEPFSTDVSDYGVYNTQTKQKDITVTVRASFRLH